MFRQTLSVIAVMSAISLMAACGSNDHNDQPNSSSGGNNVSSSSSSGGASSSSSSSSGGVSSSSSSSGGEGSSSSSSGGAPVPVNSAFCGPENTQAIQGAADVLAPQNLCVPALGFDQTSVVLVWNKPDNYTNVVNYKVYKDGVLLGDAESNNTKHSPAKAYIDKFYADDTAGFHVKARVHNFTVTDLAPNTAYIFTVRAVFKDGTESADSNAIVRWTAAAPSKTINIADAGVVAGDITDAGVIKANTIAIQKAIDDCSTGSASAYDCKVVVPVGVFKTGALFLKSNMTLQVDGTLKGSPYGDDFPLGYRLYYHSANVRPASLLNAMNLADKDLPTDKPGTYAAFENIRIVGKGSLDGNGWNRSVSPGGAVEITDELGNKLPQYRGSSNTNISSTTRNDGILAASQFSIAMSEPGMTKETAYSQRRSSLATFRHVKNLYMSGLTVVNPAFHGVMFLESSNVALNALVHMTYDANNGDGIEFGNSQNVMVFNNFLDTGDDNVNFAAGTGKEGAVLPSARYAWIFNNYFREGHGQVVTGSHTAAWIENILAEDNVSNLTEIGLRAKSNDVIGGGARNITYRDNAAKGQKKQGFIVTTAYTDPNSLTTLDYAPADASALFYNFNVSNISIDGCASESIRVESVASAGIQHYNMNYNNVKFSNCKKTVIGYLKDSIFKDVTGLTWGIDSATTNNLSFVGTTPQP